MVVYMLHVFLCVLFLTGQLQISSMTVNTYTGSDNLRFRNEKAGFTNMATRILQTPPVVQMTRFYNIFNGNFEKENQTCPSDKPFELRNGTKTVCVASCGPGMVVDGVKCINVTECTKAVLSNGMCMDRCPDGYLYTTFDTNQCEYCSYTVKDIKKNPCVKRSYLIGRVIFFIAMTALYIFFIWAFFSTRIFPGTKLMKWLKRKSNKEAKLTDVEPLINDDNLVI